jgi:hypothetical protein
MRKLWSHLWHALTVDDLFLRVCFAFMSMFAAALATALGFVVLAKDGLEGGLLLLAASFMLLFASWAALLIGGCVARPDSRWNRWAQATAMDSSAADEALIFVAVLLLPAVFVTLALRLLGVRGFTAARARSSTPPGARAG